MLLHMFPPLLIMHELVPALRTLERLRLVLTTNVSEDRTLRHEEPPAAVARE